MTRYAAQTEVSSDKSRLEIERTLSRYGATSFMYAQTQDHAVIAFEMIGRRILFKLAMPNRKDKKFTLTPTGRFRSATSAAEAYEQAVRQRWRALALVIKAKLEAVECGISEFESEFLANIVLPGGGTAGDFLIPQIARAYETGEMPKMIPFIE
jgi:hypothetical protein